MYKKLLIFVVLFTIPLWGAEIRTEIIAGDFDIELSQNIIFSDGYYHLVDDMQAGFIFSETFISPFEMFHGFAARMLGKMDKDNALVMEFYWSHDGEIWIGPITDDEVEFSHRDPHHPYMYSDYNYPDDEPAMHYRAVLHLTPEDNALIENIEFIFIDAGITEIQPQPLYRPMDVFMTNPMPPYIDRHGWGCPEADSPSYTPTYRDAWIWGIHHTAGATSTPSDPAAVVRGIWNFHVHTRGWNDIGYQFLLDHHGNIFQGRYNEDLANLDVVGAHIGGHNTGCVGLGVLGNFEHDTLHHATLTSIYALVSWKCEQRDIDPHGSSWLVSGTYPNISGHRDIGATACPGANFYPLLPQIRDSVSNRLTGGPGPGGLDTLIVNDSDPGYTTWGNWNEGTWNPSMGWDDDYQWCSADDGSNIARWTPNLPEYGEYAVYKWWYGGTNRCDGITVKIQGTELSTVVISQRTSGSAWHSLGTYMFNAGTGGYVEISDETYSGDDCSVIIADAVMWVLMGILGADEQITPDMFDIRVYPNPFNNAVNIDAPAGSRIEILDISGRLLAEMLSDGTRLIWEPHESTPSGTYIVRSTTRQSQVIRKVNFVR